MSSAQSKSFSSYWNSLLNSKESSFDFIMLAAYKGEASSLNLQSSSLMNSTLSELRKSDPSISCTADFKQNF